MLYPGPDTPLKRPPAARGDPWTQSTGLIPRPNCCAILPSGSPLSRLGQIPTGYARGYLSALDPRTRGTPTRAPAQSGSILDPSKQRPETSARPSSPCEAISRRCSSRPKTNRNGGALFRFVLWPMRASRVRQHQGLCPCHPTLAREASGAWGGRAAPYSLAEAVSFPCRVKGSLRPCFRLSER